MNSLRIIPCMLYISVFSTVNCGYISDLGLSPEELDFSPKDHNSNDYDFTPQEYQIRRGDYGKGGMDDDKGLPAPTSYASFKLESKNAVPVKIWKPKKAEPEWPQPPMMWMMQDSGEGYPGGKDDEDEEPALSTHPVPAPMHSQWKGSDSGPSSSYGPPARGPPKSSYGSPPSHGSSGGPSKGWQSRDFQASQSYSYEIMDEDAEHR